MVLFVKNNNVISIIQYDHQLIYCNYIHFGIDGCLYETILSQNLYFVNYCGDMVDTMALDALYDLRIINVV